MPGLLERDVELAAVRAFLAGAADGKGGLLLVEAGPGLGKTSLLAEALADVEGVRVMRARGAELEEGFAFGVARQLFEQPVRALAPSRRRLALAGAAHLAVPIVAPGSRSSSATPPDPFAVIHGLFWLLVNLRDDGPLVLVVDDLHWADPSSLQFLAYLAPRLDDVPVALLCAGRPADLNPQALPAVEALRQAPHTRRLELSSLSAEASTALLRRELGGALDPSFCEACHQAAGGNPFFLRELAAASRQLGIEPVAANAGRVERLTSEAVQASVRARLRRLSDAARDLARAAAVLGPGGQLWQVRELSGLDAATASVAADLLHGAGLLARTQPLDFAHPIVRAAVIEEISPSAHAAMHARAARLLDAGGADVERVAAHLLQTAPGGDEWTAGRLALAAAAAEARGGPSSAARYLRRAWAEPPAAAERAAVAAALGHALLQSDDPEGMGYLQRAVELSQTPRARAEAARQLARSLVMIDRPTEAVRTLDDALAHLGGTDAALAAELEVEILGAAQLARETMPRALESLVFAFEHELDGAAGASAQAFTGLALVAAGGPIAAGVDRARRALAGGALLGYHRVASFNCAVMALIAADDLAEAERHVREEARWGAEHGSVLAAGSAGMLRAHLEHRRGALADAEAAAREAIGTILKYEPVSYLLDALIDQGRLDEAEEELERAGLSGELPELLVAEMIVLARGRLLCARRRWAEGLEVLLAMGDRAASLGMRSPALSPWRSMIAEAQLALGDRAAATRWAEEELSIAREIESPRAEGIALRTAALCAPPAEAEPLLRTSVALLRQTHARLELARALAALGERLRRDGQRVQAREPMREAYDLAARCGAEPLRARMREELLAAGARPRRERTSGPDALTPSERRVARLAAEGLTNRQIAQTLFVTMKTVAVHLTHAYQKLDISSREELPAALRGEHDQRSADSPVREGV